MSKEITILKSVIEQCEKHQTRLTYAHDKLKQLYPFTPDKISNLENEDITYLDQYIFRFAKLQDTIGQKLFKAVLTFLGEDISGKAFIDLFNRLEQLEIIADYELWNELRTIRNDTAHEYDENKYELTEKLNMLLESKEPLEKYLKDILNYLSNRL